MIRFVFLRSTLCLPLREQAPLAGLEAGASEEVGAVSGRESGGGAEQEGSRGKEKR